GRLRSRRGRRQCRTVRCFYGRLNQHRPYFVEVDYQKYVGVRRTPTYPSSYDLKPRRPFAPREDDHGAAQ
ncbi:MAG TPA: hypothetical protein VF762_22565, partial [Blastocatellia bacterium]